MKWELHQRHMGQRVLVGLVTPLFLVGTTACHGSSRAGSATADPAATTSPSIGSDTSTTAPSPNASSVDHTFATAGSHTTGSSKTSAPPKGPSNTSPPPKVAGDYTGIFARTGGTGNFQMDIRITQNGAVLTGTTDESGVVFTDTGTITPDGHFHIVENGTVDLFGSLLGSGRLGGTWGPNGGSGTWDVALVPTISGTYSGTFTPGLSPMRIQLNQVGSVLTGTTNESGTIFTDTGSVGRDGRIQIVEREGSASADLVGSVVGPGHLAGTWVANGVSGTWDVR